MLLIAPLKDSEALWPTLSTGETEPPGLGGAAGGGFSMKEAKLLRRAPH